MLVRCALVVVEVVDDGAAFVRGEVDVELEKERHDAAWYGRVGREAE